MLTSISPFGERARGQRWGTTVTAYVVASTAGGALVGGALGLVGARALASVSTTTALGTLALLALVGLALDHGLAGLRVPGPTRQVDENWLTAYRGWAYGAGYGVQLGAAFTTIVAGSITYVAFACALLAADPPAGVAIGATFGFVRALPQLLSARATDPTELRGFMRRVDAARPRARTSAYVVQLVAAGALVAVVSVGAL
jgi:hypothetical protein